MWDYSQKVKEHYLHPRNVGEVPDPDGIGEVGNITCGDALRLTFKLDANGRITDIKFKTFGCGSAIASASVLTEMVKGKTIEEARRISNKDIAARLDGLPRQKMHCSVMGQEALEAAIKYFESGEAAPPVHEKEGPIVCTCFQVTEREIERAIVDNNLTSVEDVTNFTKAGGGCGGCVPKIQEILDRVTGQSGMSKAEPSPHLTTVQKIDAIRRVIAEHIRPVLARDGGDVELVDVDGNNVYIKFTGHCAGCVFSSETMAGVVQKNLHEKVSDQLVVRSA